MSRKIFIVSDMGVDERLIAAAEELPEAMLTWPWLLAALDDWGRATADPKRLKYSVFPALATITPDLIGRVLNILADVGLLELYTVDGKPFMAVAPETWFKIQTHIRSEKRESDKSHCPAPPSMQMRADARNLAQVRASDGKSQPSPSPSPSLSPSLSPSPSPSSTPTVVVNGESDTTPREPAPLPARSPAQPARSEPPSPPVAKLAPKPAVTTPPTSRSANPVWDACIEVLGSRPETKDECSKWGKATKQLRDAGATPDEIRLRARRYVAKWGKERLTITALVAHWGELAQEPPPQEATRGRSATTYAARPSATRREVATDPAVWEQRAAIVEERRRLQREGGLLTHLAPGLAG